MPDETPDVYADQIMLTSNIYGVALSFLKSPPHPSPGQQPQAALQVTVRMSVQHAKIMAMVLRKNLKNWERETSEIQLPHEVYNQLGISPEDW